MRTIGALAASMFHTSGDAERDRSPFAFSRPPSSSNILSPFVAILSLSRSLL